MACPIVWCAFSWEAFATLFTGVAAVAGAVWVASGQMKIQKRQAEIQAQSLRFDLFDKRFNVYQRVRESLTHARFFSNNSPEDLMQAYFHAMSESRFLFEPNVYKHLHSLWEKIEKFNLATATLQDAISDGDINERKSAHDAISKFHTDFGSELAKLPEVFWQLSIDDQAS